MGVALRYLQLVSAVGSTSAEDVGRRLSVALRNLLVKTMSKDGDKPGIVLFDNHERIHSDASFASVLTPGESLASPAIYFHEPGKLGFPKATTGTPLNAFHDPTAIVAEYPDEGRFAFLTKTQTQIFIGVVSGIALGATFSHAGISSDFGTLVALPGKIFLNVVKALVVPMVFASLATSVANIVLAGKVSAIGTRTAFYFVLFAGISAAVSLGIALALRPLNPFTKKAGTAAKKGFVNFQCPNGSYLEMTNSTGINCSADAMGNLTRFQLIDSSGVILSSTSTLYSSLSVSDQITGILEAIFLNNIFDSFNQASLLGIISFSIFFGAAAVASSPSESKSPLLEILDQVNSVLTFIIRKIVAWIPLAVTSMIASSLGTQSSVYTAIQQSSILLLCSVLSAFVIELVFYPIVLWWAIGKNPFPYMRQMIPCMLFAAGCSSSLVTLPVTIRCVESTREVSRGLLDFVLTIGATIHMDGSAMFFCNAMVFLVTTSEETLNLRGIELFMIWFVSLLGSIGSAPVPGGTLVMTYSVWATIYPDIDIPSSYSYIVATNWFVGRINTLCNVVGDTYVARIVAEQVDEAYETGYHLRQSGERQLQ